MNYCTACGEKLTADSRFCPNCGAELKPAPAVDSLSQGGMAIQAAPAPEAEQAPAKEAFSQQSDRGSAYRVKLNSLGFCNLPAAVRLLQDTLHYSAEDARCYLKTAPVEITTDMPLNRAQELADILANSGLNVSVVSPDQVEQVIQGRATIVNNYYMNPTPEVVSPKNRLAAILLCFFFGVFGVHRFYAGKIGTGILWLLTFGCFGIGYLIDFILICCGVFKDKDGLPIKTM